MSGRVTLDKAWTGMLRFLGLDPTVVAQAAGLAPHRLLGDVFQLTVAEYIAVVEATDAKLAPADALRITNAPMTEAFSPVLFATLCSSNLQAAVGRLARHKRLIAPMRVVTRSSAEALEVSWLWDDPAVQSPRLMAAVELVTFTRLVRVGLGVYVEPIRVTSPVELGAEDAYTAFFGTQVRVAEQTSITFRRRDADRAFVVPPDALWDAFEPALRRRLSVQDDHASVVERTHSALLACLPGGEVQLSQTACRMGMSGRTLQRRLAAEGTTFRAVVQSTRERLAVHYLTKTPMPYVEIGFLLGFETTTSFFRAFRSWTGQTPERAREGHA